MSAFSIKQTLELLGTKQLNSLNSGEILVKRLESQEGELRVIASDDENFDH